MSRIPTNPQLPTGSNQLDPGWLNRAVLQLYRLLGDIATQLNGVSEGKIGARHNAYTAAPTTGTYSRGDFVPNSAPAEAGSGGSKYVVTGWICTASGTPGTWLECRCLTGN